VRSEAVLSVAEVAVAGKHYPVLASSGQGLAENLAITMDQGSLQALDQGKVLVSRDAAKTHQWTVGSVLDAGIGTLKDEKLVVGGIIGKSQILNEPLIIPHTLYSRAIPPAQQGIAALLLKAVPGTDLAKLRTDLVSAVKSYIVVSVKNAKQYQDEQSGQVDQLLIFIDVLLALSIVIAFLGILNTLALSVFERTREIGLLRAVGLGRAQLSRMITMEAVSTTLFGAALGTVLGVGLGIATQHGLSSEGLHTLSVPWLQLVVIFVVAGLVGVIAAILPAIRAVRLDVLKAITTD
jgi:putative ABC transport system permease protein